MIKYVEDLILLYFYKNDDYDFNDIKRRFGITNEKLDDVLRSLLDKNMLHFENFLLHVSDKGILYLVSNDLVQMSQKLSSYDYCKFNENSKLGLDDIYIPEKFNEKYDN